MSELARAHLPTKLDGTITQRPWAKSRGAEPKGTEVGKLISRVEKRRFPIEKMAAWLAFSVVGAASSAALAAQAAASTEPSLEEITVTGTRIQQDGITAPTPVTVVDAARLQDLGATNIGNLLNTLPSFRPSANLQTTNIGPRAAGMIQADLRGLAPVRTLVLVNGRRFVPSTQEGTIDLNQIPTLLLERTEVVTGGASAQYGSDAVAGVVNIFTQRTCEGLKGELQYGLSGRATPRTSARVLPAARPSPVATATSSPRSSTRTTTASAAATRATGARRSGRSSRTPARPIRTPPAAS